MPNRFDTGDESGPIEGRDAREERLKRLPPEEKELAEESARLADLCQYFSAKRMDAPQQILDQVGGLSRLPIPDRIRALKDINQALMEYLNRVGEDPQFRQ
jgi:hypothetical protein